MIPVFQTKYGGPDDEPHEQGNCFGAAVASIFEVPLTAVPDKSYAEGNHEFWHEWIHETFGMGLLWFLAGGDELPAGYQLASVDSVLYGEDAHIAVSQDGGVVHDPNGQNPQEGYTIRQYGIFYVLDPARSLEITRRIDRMIDDSPIGVEPLGYWGARRATLFEARDGLED